jgi:hypothetical protein
MECDGVKHKCDLCKKRERGVMLYELELDDEEAELLHRALGELLDELRGYSPDTGYTPGEMRRAEREDQILEAIIAQLNESEERKTRL